MKPASWRSDDLATAFLLAYEGHTRAAYSRDLREWFTCCVRHDLDTIAASTECGIRPARRPVCATFVCMTSGMQDSPGQPTVGRARQT